jgi:hypothetical protein
MTQVGERRGRGEEERKGRREGEILLRGGEI